MRLGLLPFRRNQGADRQYCAPRQHLHSQALARQCQCLRKKHKVYPTDLRQTQIVKLGSVPGKNTHYRPALYGLYGKIAIREIYGATECMFGQ
jgi:hypothetical protein